MGMSEDDWTRFIFDLVSAILLFLIAAGGALLPRTLSRPGGERSLTFQLGNMLSAGVMLSAGFCHLLPESLPEIQPGLVARLEGEECQLHAKKAFPWGTFLCAMGLVLTLVADQLAESRSASIGLGHVHGHNHATVHDSHMSSISEEADNNKLMAQKTNSTQLPAGEAGGSTGYRAMDLEILADEKHKEAPPRVSFLTAVFLFMALSLHSVLEGAALGAQTSIGDTSRILVAIGAHKGLAAYALGASLLESQMSKRRFMMLAFGFAVASPFGIALGGSPLRLPA
eukprot:evm.model.scf_922.1 EVM.evm.TU.scf_922.1   scf_922:9446-13010(+)